MDRITGFTLAGVLLASLAGGFALAFVACGGSARPDSAAPDAGADADAAVDAGVSCMACVTDKECGGGLCAQIGGDSFCVSGCPNGNECGAGASCVQAVTVFGAQVSACVPASKCGPEEPHADAGLPPSDICGSLYGPKEPAKCSSCGGNPCQPNGCYGGWWCNTATNKCQSPPTPPSCPGLDGGSGGGVATIDGGPVTGTVTASGGTVNRLFFSVVGDTRPAVPDDTAGYPTAVIKGIYTDIQSLVPAPSFVVSTGDYQFSTYYGVQAAAQLDLYLGARALYSGPLFPTMGNHECTGATISNCGTGNANGITNNYTSYVSKLLTPISQTKPYYEIDVSAADSTWSSKFLFVAANAWDADQAAWLESAMARATTYTFLLRHESAHTNPGPPGVAASEAIMANHPYTLSIVGHTHSYSHYAGSHEIIVGNGGAPITSSKNYGFGLIQQRTGDGAIVVDMLDAVTKLADPTFHFAVNPDGTVAAP